MSLNLIDCPTGCTSIAPKWKFSKCAPKTRAAQVTDLLFTNLGYPLTNVEDPGEWTLRISNTSDDVDAIRHLTVIGSLPKPEQTKKNISGQRVIVGVKTRKVIFKIDEVTDENYLAFQQLECGGSFLWWIIVGNTFCIGGNSGIEASITGDFTASDNFEDFALLEGEIEWKSQFMADAVDWPIAADDLDEAA